MKRFMISVFVCAVFLFNLVVASPVQARPLIALSFPGFQKLELTEQQKGLLEKLEKEVLPQIESVLTPEQREQFKTSVAEGTSLRKAFKSLVLTPAQKAKLGTLFKSLPTKDAFVTLTPEQKKQLFLKKRSCLCQLQRKLEIRSAKNEDGNR